MHRPTRSSVRIPAEVLDVICRRSYSHLSHNVVWPSAEVVSSVDANGDSIILYIPNGTYLRLDRTAAQIVELLNQNEPPARVAASIAKKFGIPLEQALDDVRGVISSVIGVRAQRLSSGRRPTVAGMHHVTKSWMRQSWQNRILLAKVALVALVVELGLKLGDVSRLGSWLGVPLAAEASKSSPTSMQRANEAHTGWERRLYWAVDWVMVRWLYDGTCLRRALVLGWFLRKRFPVLCLGMLDHDGDPIAHAWIEIDGEAFDSQPLTRAFVGGGHGGGKCDQGPSIP